jgi:hypothetical protein
MRSARLEESKWKMTIQQKDDERWHRAAVVFKSYPALTIYYFLLNGVENMVHPSPYVLSPGRLNFQGDYWALAALWMALLILVVIGLFYGAAGDAEHPHARSWMIAVLFVGVVLTFSSGLCFGAGSRYRVALELAVPLFAAVGLASLLFPSCARLRQRKLPN